MNTQSFDQRAILALKRLLVSLRSRLKQVLRRGFQLVAEDQLLELNRQTQRLGSASVESVTYLGSEVRALDERLSRIEQQLAGLRPLLEERQTDETADNSDAGTTARSRN